MPSLIATACLAAATATTAAASNGHALNVLLERLQQLTGIAADEMKRCVVDVQNVVNLQNVQIFAAQKACPLTTNHVLQNQADALCGKSAAKSSNVIIVDGQPETPTDLQDIHF